MKKIGLITSGGDAPGMNACIRAIVRTARAEDIEVVGFYRGYEGLINNDSVVLTKSSVSNIIQRGGTILKTARSARFQTPEGLQQAIKVIQQHQLDGFIVIGGDGSFRGAAELAKHSGIKVIGCPGTIDNDLVGTDFTIGYDTAINTVTEAIDKLRDTAESHDRIFVVEVMGRDAGLIALRSAIAGGAEAILIPERTGDLERLLEKKKNWRKSKKSKIIIVAEGEEHGGAVEIGKILKKEWPELDIRVTVLGHIQRGGSPTCMERVNASLIGYYAVKALQQQRTNEMVGIVNKAVCYTPFQDAVKHLVEMNPEMIKILEVLSM